MKESHSRKGEETNKIIKGQAKCTPKFYYMHSNILEWASVHYKEKKWSEC
jgi:hypothetical protein